MGRPAVVQCRGGVQWRPWGPGNLGWSVIYILPTLPQLKTHSGSKIITIVLADWLQKWKSLPGSHCICLTLLGRQLLRLYADVSTSPTSLKSSNVATDRKSRKIYADKHTSCPFPSNRLIWIVERGKLYQDWPPGLQMQSMAGLVE